jgi:hypothetical protein
VFAQPLETPLTMAETTNLDAPVAINVTRLLVSLDDDGDPANGIAIPATAAEFASDVDFRLPTGTFGALTAVTNLVANSGAPTTTLVDAVTARAHLEANMLAGTWRSPDFGVLVLLNDGGWYFAEGTGGADWNGVDGGTWVYDPEFGEITFTVTFDQNSVGGIGDEPGSTQTFAVELDGAGSIVFDGQAFFAREPYGTGLPGTWSQPDEELGGFVFFADGTFIYVEAGGEPTNGLEAGTYTLADGDVALTILYSDNTNGGIDDEDGPDPGSGTYTFPAVVSGDTLTIWVPDPPYAPFQLSIYRQ